MCSVCAPGPQADTAPTRQNMNTKQPETVSTALGFIVAKHCHHVISSHNVHLVYVFG